MPMGIERREVRRFLLNLSLSKISGQGVSGKVLDFSRKGMKVILDTPVFEDKSDIQVFINRPDYNHRIFVNAAVVWVRHSEGQCEVGLKFKDIPVEDKADFLDYGYNVWLKKKLSHR